MFKLFDSIAYKTLFLKNPLLLLKNEGKKAIVKVKDIKKQKQT